MYPTWGGRKRGLTNFILTTPCGGFEDGNDRQKPCNGRTKNIDRVNHNAIAFAFGAYIDRYVFYRMARLSDDRHTFIVDLFSETRHELSSVNPTCPRDDRYNALFPSRTHGYLPQGWPTPIDL